jgi:hypothetical protein
MPCLVVPIFRSNTIPVLKIEPSKLQDRPKHAEAAPTAILRRSFKVQFVEQQLSNTLLVYSRFKQLLLSAATKAVAKLDPSSSQDRCPSRGCRAFQTWLLCQITTNIDDKPQFQMPPQGVLLGCVASGIDIGW